MHGKWLAEGPKQPLFLQQNLLGRKYGITRDYDLGPDAIT